MSVGFTDTTPIAQAMLDDLAAGKAVPPPAAEPVASPSEDAPVRTRRTRSDAGQPRGPRNVPIDPTGEALPRRTRARSAGKMPAPEPLKKEDISKLLVGAHAAAGAVLSPKARISKEDADQIAAAFVPVAEDFGIAVASKIVHVILLVATVAAVEGPIAWEVMIDMQEKRRAARARNVTQVVGGIAPTETGARTNNSSDGTKISPFGTEIGTPLSNG